MTGSPAGNSTICPVCGAENPAGSRFCERCGTRLPARPREAVSDDRASVEIAPPGSPDDATDTFQQLPAEPTPSQPLSDDPSAEPEVFERTLIGTPPIEPVAETARPAEEQLGDQSLPAGASADEPHAPMGEGATRTLPADSLRDRPTETFQLPDLSPPPSSESRNAATVSFQLPQLPDEELPIPAAADQPSSAPTTPAQPTEGSPPTSDQPGNSGWSYQSWRPDPAANRPTTGGGPGPGDTRPLDNSAAAPAEPTAPSAASTTPLPTPTPRWESAAAETPPTQPQQGNTGASSWSPAATPPGTPVGPPPSVTYPSVTAGQAQIPAAYSQSPAVVPRPTGVPVGTGTPAPGPTAYPTPVEPRNNRALWIILGVVGALLVLCALGCVLLVLIGAVSGAETSGSFATVVPTVTR